MINVGGIRFYVSWSLLDRLPQTRLGKLRRARNTQEILELCDKFNIEDNEYYFDRHPRNFGAIINFYRTGKLHLGEEGCPVAYKQDLDYWNIDELYLGTIDVTKYTFSISNYYNRTMLSTAISSKSRTYGD